MNVRMVSVVVGSVLGAAVLIGCTATDSDTESGDTISNSNNQENPPVEDVALNQCEIDEFGWLVATITVTNNSTKASNYSITVEAVETNTDNRLAEMFTFIEALRPDQVREVEVQGLEEISGKVTCKLLTVERHSSEG